MNKKTLRQRVDIDRCVYALDMDRALVMAAHWTSRIRVGLSLTGWFCAFLSNGKKKYVSLCNNSHSVRALLSHTLFRHY